MFRTMSVLSHVLLVKHALWLHRVLSETLSWTLVFMSMQSQLAAAVAHVFLTHALLQLHERTAEYRDVRRAFLLRSNAFFRIRDVQRALAAHLEMDDEHIHHLVRCLLSAGSTLGFPQAAVHEALQSNIMLLPIVWAAQLQSLWQELLDEAPVVAYSRMAMQRAHHQLRNARRFFTLCRVRS
jgi:hypothetical protein